MCAALPFLLALVASLKCHVKLKAETTLNDLLRITVCVYCPLWRLKHRQSSVSQQHVKLKRLESQISSQCCSAIVGADNSSTSAQIEFLSSLFYGTLSPRVSAPCLCEPLTASAPDGNTPPLSWAAGMLERRGRWSELQWSQQTGHEVSSVTFWLRSSNGGLWNSSLGRKGRKNNHHSLSKVLHEEGAVFMGLLNGCDVSLRNPFSWLVCCFSLRDVVWNVSSSSGELLLRNVLPPSSLPTPGHAPAACTAIANVPAYKELEAAPAGSRR